MKNLKKLIFVFAGIAAWLFPVYSQDDEDDILKLLNVVKEVENPVYMPVLGVGIGYFNFYGNVNNAFQSAMVGKPGIRLNLATYLDRKNHYFRGNLLFMTGELSGTQRSVDDLSKNLNFKSNIYSFGVNVHYSFKPWIKGKVFEPFISAGVEMLQFDSKSDYTFRTSAGDDEPYYYWGDGTIRDAPYDENNQGIGKEINRDYNYETSLKSKGQNQMTFAIPVDVGIDFNISERVTLRAATSLHYTFTDKIDDFSSIPSINPDYKTKSGNNMFTFSYLSLHVDLFSPDKTYVEEGIFLDLDMDMTMTEDEDDDGVWDGYDLCPGTPREAIAFGIDSVGCPFDTDKDGVPDYLDHEPNSRPGAIVDEYGVEINENMVIETLLSTAVRRRDVETYLMLHQVQNRQRRSEALPIPDKFRKVDRNNDGYISYDEVVKTVNDYLDGNNDFSPDDIKELHIFFFEQ